MPLTAKQREAIHRLKGCALPIGRRKTSADRVNRAVAVKLMRLGYLEWGESPGCVRLSNKGLAQLQEQSAPPPPVRSGE